MNTSARRPTHGIPYELRVDQTYLPLPIRPTYPCLTHHTFLMAASLTPARPDTEPSSSITEVAATSPLGWPSNAPGLPSPEAAPKMLSSVFSASRSDKGTRRSTVA